jgi:hypothetical protein
MGIAVSSDPREMHGLPRSTFWQALSNLFVNIPCCETWKAHSSCLLFQISLTRGIEVMDFAYKCRMNPSILPFPSR